MILLCLLAFMLLIIMFPILVIFVGGMAVFGWAFLDVAALVIVVYFITKLISKKK